MSREPLAIILRSVRPLRRHFAHAASLLVVAVGVSLFNFSSIAYAASREVNDALAQEYRLLCQRVEDAKRSETYGRAAREEQELLLTEAMASTESPHVLETISAIKLADPNEKYALFVSAVEEQTGQPWQCPAMKTL